MTVALKNHVGYISSAENMTVSNDERKTRAVKRIEGQGFDVPTLFTPWDSTASLEELGKDSLCALEEILKILLSSNYSRQQIFTKLDEAVNGAEDSRTPKPRKPIFRYLEDLRQELRGLHPVQSASSSPSKGIVGKAPSSEKPKRKLGEHLSQPPVKRTRQSFIQNFRDGIEELNFYHSSQLPESTLPYGGDQSELSDSDESTVQDESTIQESLTLLACTQASRPLRERSLRQPRIETQEDNKVAANDFGDSQLFPSSRRPDKQAVVGRAKQKNTQGDSAVGSTAQSPRNDSLNNSNGKDWRTRLEPCIAVAQREYDDIAAIYKTAKSAYSASIKSENDALDAFRIADKPSSLLSIEAIESGTPESLIEKLSEMDATEEERNQLRIAYQKKKERRIAQAKVVVQSKSSMEKKTRLLEQLQNIMIAL